MAVPGSEPHAAEPSELTKQMSAVRNRLRPPARRPPADHGWGPLSFLRPRLGPVCRAVVLEPGDNRAAYERQGARRCFMGRMSAESLREAARGRFPEAEGRTTVVGASNGRGAGVIAFTAHSVVFTDEDPEWVHALWADADCDVLAATMHPRFLMALLERTGKVTDTIGLLTMASLLSGEPELELRVVTDPVHPRVVSVRQCRDGCGRRTGRYWCSGAGWRGGGRWRRGGRGGPPPGARAGLGHRRTALDAPRASRCGPSRPQTTCAAAGPTKPQGSGWAGRRRCSLPAVRCGSVHVVTGPLRSGPPRRRRGAAPLRRCASPPVPVLRGGPAGRPRPYGPTRRGLGQTCSSGGNPDQRSSAGRWPVSLYSSRPGGRPGA